MRGSCSDRHFLGSDCGWLFRVQPLRILACLPGSHARSHLWTCREGRWDSNDHTVNFMSNAGQSIHGQQASTNHLVPEWASLGQLDFPSEPSESAACLPCFCMFFCMFVCMFFACFFFACFFACLLHVLLHVFCMFFCMFFACFLHVFLHVFACAACTGGKG